MITAFYYFIIFLSVINIGSSLHYIFASPTLLYASEIIVLVVNMALFCGLAYFMVRGLTSRKGVFSSLGLILAGILILGGLVYGQKLLDENIITELHNQGVNIDEVGLSFVNVAEYVYFLGIFATGFVFFRNRRDTKQWFPAKK